MIEMILIGCYTIPLGVWLVATILPVGLSRHPVAFSVNEMLVLLISVVLVASCVYLVREYTTTRNKGNGYLISYGLLITIGSVFSAILLAPQRFSMEFEQNPITYILGVLVFGFIPFIGVSRVWLKLKRQSANEAINFARHV